MVTELERIQLKSYGRGLKYNKIALGITRKQIKLVGKNNFVLDVGCSDGFLTKQIAKNNKVIGIELSKIAVQKARKMGLDARIGNAYKLPFKNSIFDVVHCSHLIEHVLNVDRALKEMRRVLKHGGRLIVSTPNFCSFKDRILVLFGHLPVYALHPDHVRFFNLSRLKKHLIKNGFKIKSIHGSCFSIPFPRHAIHIFIFDRMLPASIAEAIIVEAIKT